MDVTARAVGFQHDIVLTVMGTDTQFNLAVIAADDETAFRCFDEIANTDGIIRFSRSVLKVRTAAAESSRIRRKGIEIRMDASGHRIDVFHVAVNIGRCDLVPLTVLLHQFKQMGQFRAVGITPLLQHDHGGIVRSLTVALGGFKNRQSQVIEKIGLEGIGATVASDIHITDHECNFTADTLHGGIGFCFTLLHQRKVHRHTVVFHDAKIYGGRTFHLFHQKSVFRKETVKPVIEDAIQAKGEI